MSERWICSRCFTSADEAATECPNCGLPRGADAPNPAAADEEPAEAAPAEEPTAEPSPPDAATEPPEVQPGTLPEPATPAAATSRWGWW